jgi:hypothetical protein
MIPAVQVLGGAVLLRGPAVLDALNLVALGVRETRRRDGIEPSPGLQTLIAGLAAAADQVRAQAMSDAGHRDVAEQANRAQSAALQRVGTREAAQMLGLTTRQTQRLAAELGGSRGPGHAWTFDLGVVEAAAVRRASKDDDESRNAR